MGLLFLYPMAELLSLIFLGGRIGFGSLVIYLLGSFFIGLNLIRSAGFNTVKMSSPTTVLEAPFRLMAGVLILIPGLLSDFLAVLILIPFVRKVLWTLVFARLFQGRFYQKTWQTSGMAPPNSGDEDVIDVKYVREERDVTPPSIGPS